MKNKLYTIIGIILIIYVVGVNVISSTKIAFSEPVIVLAIGMIIYSATREKVLIYINKRYYLKKLVKLIKIMTICIISVLITIEGIIIVYPKHDTTNSDYILVLGAGLREGFYPTTILSSRLYAAKECIEKYGNTSKVVVSGGKGKDEKISEAEAMKKYLIDIGVSEERILVENKSTNTNENLEFSREIIENDSGKSIDEVHVKIITTDFHAFRSRFLAKKNGYSKVSNYSSPTTWYLIPITYLRESFAVVKSLLFD